jgi:hypothetical protein
MQLLAEEDPTHVMFVIFMLQPIQIKTLSVGVSERAGSQQWKEPSA